MQCTPNLQLKTNVIRLIDDTIRKIFMKNIVI
jgi:DNA-binding XRE family transcriptional regulator